MIQEVTKDLAESFGLANNNGALVVSVEKGGPAERAGIRARDIILKFDDKSIATSADLPRIVGNTKPNSKTAVEIWRDGSIKTVKVEVGETPIDDVADNRKQKQKNKKASTPNRLGLALSELTSQQKKQQDVANGLLVEGMQPGIASRSGIRVGDVILGQVRNHDGLVAVVHTFPAELMSSGSGARKSFNAPRRPRPACSCC